MRLIAVINQKGGVGKTTTTSNLAHALALKGRRVTAIDLDPQGHLTACFGLDQRNQSGLDEVLLDGVPIMQHVVNVREHLDLVPAGCDLNRFEQITEGGAKRGRMLKRAIDGHFDDRDFLLLDCPPASGLIAVNALFAADEVLVPVGGDYLSLHGLSYLISTFKNFEHLLGHRLSQWIVVTRFQARRRLAREVLEKLLEYFPGRVLKTAIRENVALAECPSFGQTIFEYKRSSNGADDYRDLAVDLVNGRTH